MRNIVNVDSRIKITNEDLGSRFPLPVSITFNGDFNSDNCQKFVDEFYAAEDICLSNKQKVLPIIIDSYGGQIYSLLRMVDVMKASKLKIATILQGKAMSAGAVLFTCGNQGYRFMSSNSTLMIHEASVGTMGKASEVEVDAEEVKRLNTLIMKMMATNCGHEEEYFLKMVHEHNHADLFLTAQDCLKHNVATSIGIPTFTTNIKVEYEFGL